MKSILKGIVIVSIAIPVSLIGMSVAGELVNKYSKKQKLN